MGISDAIFDVIVDCHFCSNVKLFFTWHKKCGNASAFILQ